MPYLGNEVAPLVQALEGKELKLDSDGDSSITADTDDQIDFKTGGTDRLQIQSTAGNNVVIADGLTLTDGNVTLASGHGIDFSATGNTSATGGTTDAELLDDYEEGTWTPNFKGNSTSGTYTFTEQQGFYIKVGGYVTAWWNITNIITGSAGSGQVLITALPFSNNQPSGWNGDGQGTASFNGWTGIDGDYINVIIDQGSSIMRFRKQTGNNNNASDINVTDKSSNDSDIRGCIHYRTF